MKRYLPFIVIGFVLLISGIFFLSKNIKKWEGMNSIKNTQTHRSYKSEILTNLSNIEPGQKTTIKYKIVNDKGSALKDFNVGHTKLMHFIVVREDLQYFQHLHPDFNYKTGEFSVNIIFPSDGPYKAFPDFIPGKSADNPMQLPVVADFHIQVGDISKYKPKNLVADKVFEKESQGYRVGYTFPQEKSGIPITYTLNVTKDEQPVMDLEKYLGSLGHSVIIKEGTLEYIHAHALEAKDEEMDNGNMNHTPSQESFPTTGPYIEFSATFPESGLYKTFTQFQHRGKVITSDFVVNIK